MTKQLMLAAAVALLSQTSFASVLTTTAGVNKIENVSIAKSAEAEIDGQKVTLTTVGAGVRTKRVVVTNVKVYVAQLFAADPAAYVRDDAKALDSIANQSAAAVQLTFLRGVDADKVQSSFKDALDANGVKLSKAEIVAFLDAVKSSGDAEDKKTLTIATSTSAAGDLVVYEGTEGKATTVRGPKGFARDVMSIWLGEPSDNGVAKLKEQLLTELK